MSVDGTDFKIEANSKNLKFYSHKFLATGLRYEIALCIQTGEIVWYSGPHYPGNENDLMIFRHRLLQKLGPTEQVEADAGYAGEHAKVRYPGSFGNAFYNNTTGQTKVRWRHEHINGRFEFFHIMKNKFRHEVEQHGTAFGCVAVLAQLNIFGGQRLKHVEYPMP